MADVNAPSGQTPAMAPPIAVDLLKKTNFFTAFTASSTIPSIYIQQFWDTILYDKKVGCYRCQLDEQWPSISSTPADLEMDEDMGPDEQAQLSDNEDTGSAHIPEVNLRQGWWKPLEEKRPATPEPAWSILSFDAPIPPNNWASALASSYLPPPEDSLLAQTGDMTTFIDWFCKRRGITELKPQDLEGPTFEIIKGGPIAPIAIQATNSGLKNDMIQQVQNSCQFHGLPGDDANKHLDKFLHVTQSIKVNGVTDDALRLYLFPHSLTHHATAWFDRLPRNSINTFEQMAKMFLGQYFPPSMVTKLRNEISNFLQRPNESLFEAWERYKLSIDRCGTFMKRRPEECYDLIENMTAHHNDWDTSAQRSEPSDSITSSSDTEIATLKAEMAKINKNLMRVLQFNQQVKAVTSNCELVEGASHSQNPPPAYQAPVYQAPVHLPQIPQPQVLTTNEFTNFMKANDAILKNMPTNMTSLTNSNLKLKNMFDQFMKMNTASSLGLRTLLVIAPIIEPVVTPVSAPKPNQRPSILYPSRLQDQKLRDKANDQREKLFQIFKDLNFNISFADALILMPKFGPAIKTLLTKKDKLYELARTPLNEHCSVVLLYKLSKKLADPNKFLIPCDFPRMAECLALANLGASINLMPFSVWNKLSIPNLSPTCMTLELVDHSISHPVRVAEDFFVKVGTFHFPTDFVVVDFDADPRVPLILERSFFKIGRALIDVFKGELTLRVGKEAITFNLDQTSRYSANYNDMIAKRIDVIDMSYEEYSQEVLGFSNVIASGNPTPYYDPIVSTTSPTLTPFDESDFLLEEVDAFLALEDDPTSPKVDQSYVDTEGDILLLEAFLNDDPSLPPLNQGNYLP
nr:reverse transcriptase domain-containing protein [Tanacetum cinerariifolium]